MDKKVITIIVIMIFIVCIALIGTSKAFYVKSNSNEIISGTITGTFADFTIESMYVDNEEIQSMASVPSGYVIDEENSYCYITTSSEHDTNVHLYTNDDGEHIISGISKSDKCILYFKDVPLVLSSVNLHYAASPALFLGWNGDFVLSKGNPAKFYVSINSDNNYSEYTFDGNMKSLYCGAHQTITVYIYVVNDEGKTSNTLNYTITLSGGPCS